MKLSFRQIIGFTSNIFGVKGHTFLRNIFDRYFSFIVYLSLLQVSSSSTSKRLIVSKISISKLEYWTTHNVITLKSSLKMREKIELIVLYRQTNRLVSLEVILYRGNHA